MRLPVERHVKFRLGRGVAALGLLSLVSSCGGASAERPQQIVGPATSGPAADYPMVLGAPFTVDGVTYTPADTLNYDEVGYASVGTEGGAGVSLADRVLPLPSYVEVTSLRTGKTILVRVERRGPMTGSDLVELSPGAAQQLGIAGDRTPVRVRRVNPPEVERALLRTGQRAPERMDTPLPLVGVLLRKLDPSAAPPVAPAPTPAPTPTPSAATITMGPSPVTPAKAPPAPVKPAKPAAKPAAVEKPAPRPEPSAPAAAVPAKGSVVVQVGAFSSADRAAAVARKVGGHVTSAGRFYRVRIGSFSSTSAAQGALAKAKAAGYSDARIQRAD